MNSLECAQRFLAQKNLASGSYRAAFGGIGIIHFTSEGLRGSGLRRLRSLTASGLAPTPPESAEETP